MIAWLLCIFSQLPVILNLGLITLLFAPLSLLIESCLDFCSHHIYSHVSKAGLCCIWLNGILEVDLMISSISHHLLGMRIYHVQRHFSALWAAKDNLWWTGPSGAARVIRELWLAALNEQGVSTIKRQLHLLGLLTFWQKTCRMQEQSILVTTLFLPLGVESDTEWHLPTSQENQVGDVPTRKESMCFCMGEDSTVPEAPYPQQNSGWVQCSGRALASTDQENIKSTLVWDAHAHAFMSMPSYFLKTVTFMRFF